jgi:quaternary ammonium compound-resistance protein SugE
MALLEMSSRTIPMGTAYAVWGGIGAIGTVIVGMVWFGEPVTPIRIALIVAVILCISGLKLAGAH